MMSYSGLHPNAEGRIPRPPKNPSDQIRNQSISQIGGITTKNLNYRYCCFAIPLYNAGIYSILAQFTICGFVLGILSLFAPSILAIAIDPAFTIFFGVLCFLVGAVQAAGFYAVYKEKPTLFKKYFIMNSGLLIITLIYSLILLIVSSTKHEAAIVQCLVQFVANDEFLEGPSNTSREVCGIWTYVQLAVCFVVWILFLLSELYFCYMVKLWGKEQKQDHIQYKSILSAVRQSMAASSHRAGLLDEESDWESESRVESLDLCNNNQKGSRSSQYSKHHGRSGSSTLVNGGSRLKNEIEWKETTLPLGQDHHVLEKDGGKGKLKQTEGDDQEEVVHFRSSSDFHSVPLFPSRNPNHHENQQQQQEEKPNQNSKNISSSPSDAFNSSPNPFDSNHHFPFKSNNNSNSNGGEGEGGGIDDDDLVFYKSHKSST